MTPTERANEIERWFPQRGVPHLIESDSDASSGLGGGDPVAP